ncbi:MAG: hypothetical protein MO853_12035 [Candidatus Protistobacter heckmanni]|nr:hypothetical protein [Candidatus Protistobacter heckmanni]
MKLNKLVIALGLMAAAPAFTKAPAAGGNPPPPWKQGIGTDSATATLHPFSPNFTGAEVKDPPIDKLKVPAGFKIEVWAEGVPEARSLALSDKSTVFVSNRLAKNIYAVIDRGGKREVKTILKGLNSPSGIIFSKGTLFVAERDKITRYDGIEDNLDNPPAPKLVFADTDPTNGPGHFWKYLAMGPDGKLYFNIGSPQNITTPNYIQAAIHRVDPKTGKF